MTAPATPAAPRAPCAPCHEQMLAGALASNSLALLFLKRFLYNSPKALNVRPNTRCAVFAVICLFEGGSCSNAMTTSNDVLFVHGLVCNA